MQQKQNLILNLKKSIFGFNFFFSIICFTVIFLVNLTNSEARIKVELLQKDSVYYTFVLNDDTELIAKVIEYDSLSITLTNNTFPQIIVLQDKIKSIRDISFNKAISTDKPSNNSKHRYLISPSAIPMNSGDIEYQNAYLFINMLNFGITDNFSLLVGTEFLISAITGYPVVFIAPKLAFKLNEDFHLGVGGLRIQSFSGLNNDNMNYTVAYAMGTYGTEYNNLTLNLGAIENPRNNSVLFYTGLSSMIAIGSKTYLVGEFWTAPNDSNFNNLILGIRLSASIISFDFGYFYNAGSNTRYNKGGLPYLSAVIRF